MINVTPIYNGKWNETYKESVRRQALIRSRKCSGRRDRNEILLYRGLCNLLGGIIFMFGVILFFSFITLVLGC